MNTFQRALSTDQLDFWVSLDVGRGRRRGGIDSSGRVFRNKRGIVGGPIPGLLQRALDSKFILT